MPTTYLLLLDDVRVDVPDFPGVVRTPAPDFGDGNFYAHVQGYLADSDMLQVSLELPDDSPAMQDAVADGNDPEQAEFVAFVPRVDAVAVDLLRMPDSPVEDPRPALEAGMNLRVMAAERAAREERVQRYMQEMRDGKRKRLFPELG